MDSVKIRMTWKATLAALLLVTASPHVQAADSACLFFSSKEDDKAGPPLHFAAALSAYEESAVTDSPGKGHIDFVLDRATLKLTWKVTFEVLTSAPTGLQVHGPQVPGADAAALFDLAPKGVKSPMEGEMVLTDGLVTYLVQDRLYVNLVTTKYPNGELRSPIVKIRPKC